MSNFTELPPISVQLVDEAGNAQEFNVMTVFPVGDLHYAAIVGEDDTLFGEPVTITLVRFGIENQEYVINLIDTEEEWAGVKATFAHVAARLWPGDMTLDVEGEGPIDLHSHRPN